MNRYVLWSVDRILKMNSWKHRRNVWRSGYDLEEEEAKIFPVTEILKKINCYSSIGFYALEMKCKGLEVRESYEIQAKSVNPYNNSFEMLTQDLKTIKKKWIQGNSVVRFQNPCEASGGRFKRL